ncbi:T9SS type A sorting domain-containing protein [Hymenobacter sp. BT491]|nr:T9SS type A sorting domain-containing protein [Hymenobacter sp. BT491]
MKAFLHICISLITILLAAAPSAQAQQAVPNGTMETWQTRNGGDVPQSWLTTDDALAAAGIPSLLNTGTVSKSTDHQGGSFAAKLETKTTILSALLGPVPGILLLGSKLKPVTFTNLASAAASINGFGGLPYTSRPTRLQFSYKLTGTTAATDSAFVLIVLTRTVNRVPLIVGDTILLLKPTATYSLTDLPIRYRRTDTPDTLRIAFASGVAVKRTAGTALFVDDITLTGTVTAAKNPQLEAALSVYPNPSAAGEFRLTSPTALGVATAPFTVTDPMGRVVRQEERALNTNGGRTIDLRGQPAGLYLLHLSTPAGPLTRKLLIQ